jgi:hypothetical protein
VEREIIEQDSLEEAPFSPEFPDLEIPETSTSRHNKVSKPSKIEKIQEEIAEMNLLERVIRSKNHTIRNTSDEVRDCFERLAKMHVKEQKRNKKLLNDNRKLLKMIRGLRIKLKLKNPNPRVHPDLRVLSEVAENLNEDPKEYIDRRKSIFAVLNSCGKLRIFGSLFTFPKALLVVKAFLSAANPILFYTCKPPKVQGMT